MDVNDACKERAPAPERGPGPGPGPELGLGLVSEEGRNIKSVLCQRCGSKVLCPGTAQFTEKQLFLPSMRKKSGSFGAEGSDGDTLMSFWLVHDMFDFENVGFTNDVGRIKFLICADCEIGPIGWHCLDDQKNYYIALERVKHE